MSTTVGILFNCKLAEFIVVSRQAPYSIGHIAAAAVTVADASNHLARELPPYTSANVIVDATEATERNISYGEQKISKAAQK